MNEAKFGFNRSTAYTTNINQTGVLYAFSASPDFTTLNNNKTSIGAGNSFAEIDNVTWIKGRHVVKAGVEIRRVQMNQGNTVKRNGEVHRLVPWTAFEANEVSTASLTGALPVNGLRKTQYFRLRPG